MEFIILEEKTNEGEWKEMVACSLYFFEQSADFYKGKDFKEDKDRTDQEWLIVSGLADPSQFEGEEAEKWRVRREVRKWNNVPDTPFYIEKGKEPETPAPENDTTSPPVAQTTQMEGGMSRETAIGLVRRLAKEPNLAKRKRLVERLDTVPTWMMADIKVQLEKEWVGQIIAETPDSEKPLELLEAEKKVLEDAYKQLMTAKHPETGAKLIPDKAAVKKFALKFKSLRVNINKRKNEKELEGSH